MHTTTPRSVDVQPTLDQFRRHAQRFGPDCVIETARGLLPDPQVQDLALDLGELAGGKRRPTTPSMTEQVIDLADRGLVPAAIADALNISDRRVAEILAKRSTRRNGGRKRLG